MRRLAGIGGIATALVMAVSLVAVASHTFNDVPSSHTFHADIDWLADEGVTRGCNPPANTNYCPDDNVTRGQMAAFLVRYLGLTEDTHPGFVDVPADHTFANDIGKLATQGITRGCNPPLNDRFCPDDPVTREQMAAFLVRGLGLDIDNGWEFDDVDLTSTFARDISKLASSGATRGCNPPANTEFCPKDDVTRGQMAAFLKRGDDPGNVQPPGAWEAFTVSGSGNDVIALSVPNDDPALLDLEHDGSDNFIVWSRDSQLNLIDLLVNTIGPYEGRRGLNIEWLFSLDPVRHLDITADGNWSITVRPVSQARLMSGSLSGGGDEVVRFAGAPVIMHSTHDGSSNFIIIALTSDGQWHDLIVNEIGPYDATDVVPSGTQLLSIRADGNWSLNNQ